jgi:hypothetical protein
MARLDVLAPEQIADPELRRTFGVAPMGPRSHAVLEGGNGS